MPGINCRIHLRKDTHGERMRTTHDDSVPTSKATLPSPRDATDSQHGASPRTPSDMIGDEAPTTGPPQDQLEPPLHNTPHIHWRDRCRAWRARSDPRRAGPQRHDEATPSILHLSNTGKEHHAQEDTHSPPPQDDIVNVDFALSMDHEDTSTEAPQTANHRLESDPPPSPPIPPSRATTKRSQI